MHPHFTPKQISNFWSHVQKAGPEDCWEWQGKRTPQGYGRWAVVVDKRVKSFLTSRISYSLTHGKFPDAFACHTCDNPPCCNPAHLFDGTPSQNTQDSYDKGRKRGWSGNGSLPPQCDPAQREKFLSTVRKGEAHHFAKLTPEQVKEMRKKHEQGALFVNLAREYNMSRQQCSKIIKRQRWAHI